MTQNQTDLFADTRTSGLPAGFSYQAEFIDRAEELRLVEEIEHLELAPFEFHGFLGKRRVISFGWRYDFNGGGLQEAKDMPSFLMRLRDAAAAFSGLHPLKLQQVSLIEYPAGAAIGWHRDRVIFGEVIGISLLSACTLRFRKKLGARWARSSITLGNWYLSESPSSANSIETCALPRSASIFPGDRAREVEAIRVRRR
jgi:alkylated DNA repair dioxygenase AlkB